MKPQAGPSEGLVEAVALLDALTKASGLTPWIAGLEVGLQGADGAKVGAAIERDGIGRATLDAALLIKRVSGQINVLVHAIGILNALPHILEPGECVESLSLGAGNTGRPYDLETDKRVAEFKFTAWRGRPESIRQKNRNLWECGAFAGCRPGGGMRNRRRIGGPAQPPSELVESKRLNHPFWRDRRSRTRTSGR